MGGPQQNPSQLLLGGRVDMIMSNSFEAINYARENLPFLCIASIFQKDPQVIISHPGVGNDSFAALKGKPILVGAGGRNSFWPFLKAKFGFTDEQVRPYTFNMAPFLADKTDLAAGLPVVRAVRHPQGRRRARGASDRRRRLRELQDHDQHLARRWWPRRRTLVQRFVTATLEGWAAYMKGGRGQSRRRTP